MYRRLWLALIALLPGMAQASMEAAELRGMLERLQGQALWGEAVLTGGQIRSIQVDSLKTDSVAVREVIGPLQERSAVYALSDFASLRELGERRIPLRRALYQPRKSTVGALLLEAAIPGSGYFYIGEARQGLILVGLAAAAVGTGIATGEDGAAGWVPISAWIKVASLLNLRDETRAMNQAAEEGDGGGNGNPLHLPGQYQRELRIGGLSGRHGMVPARQGQVAF